MIKNLLITNVPKDIDQLNKLLMYLGDHSWTDEGKRYFVSEQSKNIMCVWYCPKYESYFGGDPDYDPNHIHKTFEQVVP